MKTFDKNEVTNWPVPNYWDMIALLLVVAIIVSLGFGATRMLGDFHLGQRVTISTNPHHLPYYALLTVLRMMIALLFSLLVTLIFGTWAAKSRQAERIIIPCVDILQSVPVLGFLSITVVGFIVLFRGSMLGPECAAIFAIFSAQVWNMILSFYQSMKMVPQEMHEASAMFQLSRWQKFWRVEAPSGIPGLIWNMMLSMSSSWIFLVYSEAISVANHKIFLPGIGSYIATAILEKNKLAIVYAILTMIIVIALVDQLIFRPLVAWSEKFKMQDTLNEEEPESWVLTLLQQTRFLRYLGEYITILGNKVINAQCFRRPYKAHRLKSPKQWHRLFVIVWNLSLISLLGIALTILYQFIFNTVSLNEALSVLCDGLATALRVSVALLISSLIWIPLGILIGLSPRATQIIQPIAQFLAAFPMNLIFPLVVWGMLRFDLNVNIWVTPLIILGAQWYILFNVIAGASAIPKNLHHAIGTLNVRGWLWWRRLMLPGIFPHYITGAITAAGAAWNVSIIAEAVSWGSTHLWATGLGAYIVKVSDAGDFPRLALGIVIMSLYVIAFNRLIWRPLYNIAESRYQLR